MTKHDIQAIVIVGVVILLVMWLGRAATNASNFKQQLLYETANQCIQACKPVGVYRFDAWRCECQEEVDIDYRLKNLKKGHW